MRYLLVLTLSITACTFEGAPAAGAGDSDNPDASVDPTPFALRVNLGSNGVPYQGIEYPGLWSADPNACSADGTNRISGDIRGTVDDVLFRENLFGHEIACAFPVATGRYTVRLFFAEIFRGGGSCLDDSMDRSTAPTIEGAAHPAFDVIEMSGGCAVNSGTVPVSMSYEVDVSDGAINLEVTGADEDEDHAILSAVEVTAL